MCVGSARSRMVLLLLRKLFDVEAGQGSRRDQPVHVGVEARDPQRGRERRTDHLSHRAAEHRQRRRHAHVLVAHRVLHGDHQHGAGGARTDSREERGHPRVPLGAAAIQERDLEDGAGEDDHADERIPAVAAVLADLAADDRGGDDDPDRRRERARTRRGSRWCRSPPAGTAARRWRARSWPSR